MKNLTFILEHMVWNTECSRFSEEVYRIKRLLPSNISKNLSRSFGGIYTSKQISMVLFVCYSALNMSFQYK